MITKKQLKNEIGTLRNDMAAEFVKRDNVIEAHTIHLEAFHKLIYGWAKDLGEIMRRMETLEGAAKADLPKKEEYVAPEVKAEDPTLFSSEELLKRKPKQMIKGKYQAQTWAKKFGKSEGAFVATMKMLKIEGEQGKNSFRLRNRYLTPEEAKIIALNTQ